MNAGVPSGPGSVTSATSDSGGIVAACVSPGIENGLGESPVDDERLPVGAEHDVGRLEVAMEDTLAVGKRHGLAGRDQPAEQRPELEDLGTWVPVRPVLAVELLDRLVERVAPDQPHRIAGEPFTIVFEAVDGNDARMFELSGDLDLAEESATA